MSTPTANHPYPGSDAAVEDGCICPRLDNGRGNAALAYDRGGWIVTVGCPLHDFLVAASAQEER